MADRDLSVVVFGATGVTGRQVAAYLAQRAKGTDIRWAAAGRDPAKVERILGEIGVTAPETIAADVSDPATLEAMASRTHVVLDLVGPYTLYGQPVIEACIAAGTHYADLTGEIPFVRRMIDTLQSKAEATGVKIVNVSGFEALPADLAVLLAAETARDRWDEALATVDLDASLPTPPGVKPADMISGGTLQSLAEATSDERAELASDPGALITEPELAQRVRDVSPIAVAPRFNAEGDVIGPMLPSPFINPAVIHRTAALIAAEEKRPLEPFRYREGVAVDSVPAVMPLRYAAAGVLAGVQVALRAVSRAKPSTRQRLSDFMRKRLPSSGFGPKGEGLNDWTWKLTVNAKTAGGHYVRVDLDADGHPGYLATARMLGEAGLLLAEDGATPARNGFLTPAAALGTAHLDRFERAEMRLSVSS